LIAETLLIKEKHGTKFGWTLSPWKPYLKKKWALLIGAIQVSITIFVPMTFLTNFFVHKYCTFENILYPISIIFWYTFGLTTIREPKSGRYIQMV
jgi:hypothetical protein